MIDFPEEFFKEEIQWDFKVTEMTKRSWAAQMEILKVLIDICDQNNLTYYVDGGTLLGAVRHQGFIPWDDDIDVALKREDYNKLVELLPTELPKEFIWTGPYSMKANPAVDWLATQIITNPDAISFDEYMHRFHNFPLQIGIDIYPLDVIPRDKDEENMQLEAIKILLELLSGWNALERDNILEGSLANAENFLRMKFTRDKYTRCQIWRTIDALSAMYHPLEGDELTNYPLSIAGFHMRLKQEWYDKSVSLTFGCMTVNAPARYREVLTSCYGDYMSPVKFASLHEYKDYKDELEEFEEHLRSRGIDTDVTSFCHNYGK